MASAAAEEITAIFFEVIKENLVYCSVCLKTSKERQLVKSDAFKTFLQLFHLTDPQNDLVCSLCEAQIARATQMFHLATFAVAIDRCFKKMATHVKWLEKGDMQEYLQRIMAMELSGQVPLEEGWRLANARSTFVRTAMLRVDTHNSNIEQIPEPLTMLNVQAIRRINNPKSNLEANTGPKISKNLVLENVVVIDDDEGPKEPDPPRLVPIETLLEDQRLQTNIFSFVPNEMQVMARDINDPLTFILHPVVYGSDGSVLVPSLNYQICDGLLTPLKAPTIQFTPKVVASNPNNPLKIMEIPPLTFGNRIHFDDEETRNDSDATEKPESPIPVYMVNVNSESVGILGLEGSNDEEAASDLVTHEVSRRNDLEDNTPTNIPLNPPQARGRIDWEDKIPMDVISLLRQKRVAEVKGRVGGRPGQICLNQIEVVKKGQARGVIKEPMRVREKATYPRGERIRGGDRSPPPPPPPLGLAPPLSPVPPLAVAPPPRPCANPRSPVIITYSRRHKKRKPNSDSEVVIDLS